MDRRGFIVSAASFGLFAGCLGGRVRLDAATEARIRAEIERLIESGIITCAVCGDADGASFCLGNRRPLGAETPVAEDSLFEIASVSKLFTASIAARLWCEGRLDIDAPFTEYLTDHVLAKKGTDITVRDLAAHVSGFGNGWMAKAGVWGKGPFPFATFDDYRRALCSAEPEAPRRRRYVYACHNYILLGLVLENITGLDLDAAARRYVWEPLGMRDTTWKNCPDDPRTVQIYTKGPCPPGTKGDENARAFPHPVGNAGVFTNLVDLRKFLGDMVARGTFEKEYYDLLLGDEWRQDGERRTFGWNRCAGGQPDGWSEETVYHLGYTGQYVAVDPVRGRAGAVLMNFVYDDAARRRPVYSARRRILAALCDRGEG